MIETINAIWLGNKMTPLSFACIDDWKKQGYAVRIWTENDKEIIQWINDCKFAKECFHRKLYAFVTDYLRLKVLQHSGGLYLDTDVTIQQNPFPLFDSLDFAVGYESNDVLGTAVIYANKKSTILTELISFYEKEIMSSPLFMGPEIMTELLIKRNQHHTEHYTLFSQEYFYAYQGECMNFDKSDNSHLIHWFQHSWKKSKHENFLKTKDKGILGKLYVWQKYLFRFKK